MVLKGAITMTKQKTKRRRGPSPVIIPREINEWIKRSSTNAKIENYLKGGGKRDSYKKT